MAKVIEIKNNENGIVSCRYIDSGLELEDLQKAVGGWIEMVSIRREDLAVVCDEEGRLTGKPYTATIDGISYVGNLLIVGTHNCDVCGVPDGTLERLSETGVIECFA